MGTTLLSSVALVRQSVRYLWRPRKRPRRLSRPKFFRLTGEKLEDIIAPGSLLGMGDLGSSLDLAGGGSLLGDVADIAMGGSASAKGKPGKSPATSTNTVSGEAFGVFVDVETLAGLVHVSVPKTPHVVLPSSGGFAGETVLTVSAPADGSLLSSQTLHVMTAGSAGPTDAFATSVATTEEVNLLNGLITADVVLAMSTSYGDGSSATSDATGSAIVGLTINLPGLTFDPVIAPPPNTTIPLPGIGSIILNEQLPGGDGVHTSALTVNMIHVRLNGLLGSGDIIVSSAHSDVNFTAPQPPGQPPADNRFMTGGGRIGEGSDFATFGFNAGDRNGARKGGVQGQLQYNDHAADLKVHSTSITSFSVLDDSCVTFSGTARVNGVDGYTFTVTEACDNGEPGVGTDTFSIQVTGAGVNYTRSGVLTGGNLQLHPVS
jgi:hypothetical protein